MKKVLTFLAVAVLAAVSTQAAAVKWASGNMTDNNGDPIASGSMNTYLWTVDAATYATLSGKTQDQLIESYKDATATATATSTSNTSAGKSTVETSADAGTTVYGVLLYEILDDKGNVAGHLAGVASGTVNSKGSTLTINSIGTTAFDANNGKWNDKYATPIPEPTAVALIALGLAALGLKRKVA